MDNERANQLHAMLKEFRNTVDGQLDKKLDLEKCSRIIEKLGTFATECEECTQHLFDLENHFTQLNGHSTQLSDGDFQQHKQVIEHTSSHLMKQHNLVHSGIYTGIFMSLGTSLGIVFGLLIFDNLA